MHCDCLSERTDVDRLGCVLVMKCADLLGKCRVNCTQQAVIFFSGFNSGPVYHLRVVERFAQHNLCFAFKLIKLKLNL